MNDDVRRYVRAVANLAWHTGHQCNAMPTREDLDAIIASVPAPFYDDENHDCFWRRLHDARSEDKIVRPSAPEAQHHDAPTCEPLHKEPCEACVTCECGDATAWGVASGVDEDGCCARCGGVHAAAIVHCFGGVPHPEAACARIQRHPLLPPDTTEPAPKSLDPLVFLDTMSHDLAMAAAEEEASKPAPVATPPPDIDPEEVRRAIEKWSTPELSTTVTRRVLVAAAREWLRLREQPAPDVQAQIDAAVAACEQRCATQLADYVSRAADDERVRTAAAVAREREECAKVCEANYFRAGIEIYALLRASSAKGE